MVGATADPQTFRITPFFIIANLHQDAVIVLHEVNKGTIEGTLSLTLVGFTKACGKSVCLFL